MISNSLKRRANLITQMRDMSIPALSRLYRPAESVYSFRVRKTPRGEQFEGISRRYTAIALIGLSSEPDESAAAACAGHDPRDVCAALLANIESQENLGDVALALWAAKAFEHRDSDAALRRLLALWRDPAPKYTVELAWALTALCLIDANNAAARVRDDAAQRLLGAYSTASRAFPHTIGGKPGGLRAHVACFADQVYPIYALSKFHALSGRDDALAAADGCGAMICERMGSAGQWWWHYDYRTGAVVEGYPVYAIHQDAMAPMALFALRDAGGKDWSASVASGLDWLAASPELGGESLIDRDRGWIWRKVARREPRKLVRKMQAVASSIRPWMRVPGADALFPPTAVDWESRPYHYGWLLHAFPARTWAAQQTAAGALH